MVTLETTPLTTDSNVQNIVTEFTVGKKKSNAADVVISTWQSIYKFPQKWFEQFDVVYGDEPLVQGKVIDDSHG